MANESRAWALAEPMIKGRSSQRRKRRKRETHRCLFRRSCKERFFVFVISWSEQTVCLSNGHSRMSLVPTCVVCLCVALCASLSMPGCLSWPCGGRERVTRKGRRTWEEVSPVLVLRSLHSLPQKRESEAHEHVGASDNRDLNPSPKFVGSTGTLTGCVIAQKCESAGAKYEAASDAWNDFLDRMTLPPFPSP